VGSQRDRTDALDHRKNAPLKLRSCRDRRTPEPVPGSARYYSW
jgi:hypothetical protein